MFTFKHFFLLNFHCLTYSAVERRLGKQYARGDAWVRLGDTGDVLPLLRRSHRSQVLGGHLSWTRNPKPGPQGDRQRDNLRISSTAFSGRKNILLFWIRNNRQPSLCGQFFYFDRQGARSNVP